jgi:hypothetical protein
MTTRSSFIRRIVHRHFTIRPRHHRRRRYLQRIGVTNRKARWPTQRPSLGDVRRSDAVLRASSVTLAVTPSAIRLHDKPSIRVSKPSQTVVRLLTGVVTAVAMQTSGWWLNSGPGVARTMLVFVLLGALCGEGNARSRRARVTALWLGAMMGLAAVLFWFGPGTIWPIVLVASALLTASAILAGSGIGWLCRSR